MRARNIKPGFFINEELAALPPLARILFAGLWCMADREGRLEDRPKRIKVQLLPYDDCNVDELLQLLADAGFIRRYEVRGIRVIDIPTFKRHQNPHKNEKTSELPAYEEIEKLPEEIEKLPERVEKCTKPLRLNPDSLNPDSLNTNSKELARAEAPAQPQKDIKEASPTARDLVAYYVDQARAEGLAVTSTDKGRMGRYVKEVLCQGVAPYVIRAAIDRMVEKRLGPHLLGQLCNEVEPRARPSPAEFEQILAEAMAKAREAV